MWNFEAFQHIFCWAAQFPSIYHNARGCISLYISQTFDKKALAPVYMVADNVFGCKPLFFYLGLCFSPLSLFLHFGFHFLFFHLHYFFDFFFSKATIHKVAKYFSNGHYDHHHSHHPHQQNRHHHPHSHHITMYKVSGHVSRCNTITVTSALPLLTHLSHCCLKMNAPQQTHNKHELSLLNYRYHNLHLFYILTFIINVYQYLNKHDGLIS